MPDLVLRFANSSDAPQIAALHASSWRSAYAEALSSDYLKHYADSDRLTLWQQRLSAPASNQRVILLEQSGLLLGFACLFIDADPQYGTLLDNLHVVSGRHRTGLGTQLMIEVKHVTGKHAAARPVHLWVIKTNLSAQRFYASLGATCDDEDIWNAPDGSHVPVYRFAWPNPAAMCVATSSYY